MNKFIITDFEHRVEQLPMQAIMGDPFSHPHKIDQQMTCQLTIKPLEINEESLKKLYNIHKHRRPITLNDSEYAHFMEPFKDEFIDFMMNKHPDKILSNTEAWDNLIG